MTNRTVDALNPKRALLARLRTACQASAAIAFAYLLSAGVVSHGGLGLVSLQLCGALCLLCRGPLLTAGSLKNGVVSLVALMALAAAVQIGSISLLPWELSLVVGAWAFLVSQIQRPIQSLPIHSCFFLTSACLYLLSSWPLFAEKMVDSVWLTTPEGEQWAALTGTNMAGGTALVLCAGAAGLFSAGRYPVRNILIVVPSLYLVAQMTCFAFVGTYSYGVIEGSILVGAIIVTALMAFLVMPIHLGSANRGTGAVILISAVLCVPSLVGGLYRAVLTADLPDSIVVLHSEGAEWSVPEVGKYGAFSQGMFGLLFAALERIGAETRVIDPRLEDLEAGLANADVLIVINGFSSDDPLTSAGQVSKWCREGGQVIVLADHTDVFGQMASTNALCAPHGISLRFDSAYPLQGRTLLRKVAHASTSPAWDMRQGAPSIGIGCALDVSGDAQPLIWSNRLFSDRGNYSNVPGSFLGNYHLDKGESAGLVVLAARAEVGRGAITVFGDTTFFQNAGISKSLDSAIVPLLMWVSSGANGRGYVVMAVLTATLALVLATVRNMRVAKLVLVIPLGALPVATAWLEAQTHSSVVASEDVVILEDLPERHLDAIGKSIMGPFLQMFVRTGSWVSLADSHDLTEIMPRAVVIGPLNAPLSRHHSDQLESYLSLGGNLIVQADGLSYRHLASLLSRLDLVLRPGATPPDPATKLQCSGIVTLEGLPDSASPINWHGEGVGYRLPVGKGVMTLICLSEVFSGSNLESARSVSRENADLAVSLVNSIGGGSQ